MTQQPTSGKVAIVEIAAPERTVLMIEVVLDGETLTISDDPLPLTDTIREAAVRLLEAVRSQHGQRTANH
jgi:hypothetical protein